MIIIQPDDLSGILSSLGRARRHFKIYIGTKLYDLKAMYCSYSNRTVLNSIYIRFVDMDGGEGEGELMISRNGGINYVSFTYSPKKNKDSPKDTPKMDDIKDDAGVLPYVTTSTSGIPLSFYEKIWRGRLEEVKKSWNGRVFNGDLKIFIVDEWISGGPTGFEEACLYDETSHYRDEWFDRYYKNEFEDAFFPRDWKPPFFINNRR